MAVHVLWRIATETRDYKSQDLSGIGASRSPGRWNAPGEYVVYAAETIALAVLETAAHIDDAGLPLNRFVIRIEVPAIVWKARGILDVENLDASWAAIPGGKTSIEVGSAWYRTGETALLCVPSVIVPEERAVLINAKHRDAKNIKATVHRQFDYNRLFRSAT